MRNLYFPDNTFYKKLQKMPLAELEQFIKSLCKYSESSSIYTDDNHEQILACLRVRHSKLNKLFECTPENVERLHRVANLVKDRSAMLRKKGSQMYSQMWQIWKTNQNEGFTDFYVELQMFICYNDEDSIFDLPDDNSGSDYRLMSEILSGFYFEQNSEGFLIKDISIDYYEKDEKAFLDYYNFVFKINNYDDDWGEPWFFEKFPELKKLPITREFHDLLFHSLYSLQDIIRINDIWSEAKVVWQCIDRVEAENSEK